MKSRRTRRFHECFAQLPSDIQSQARQAYQLFQDNPGHPGLRFKRVHQTEPIYSVRVNQGYRAVGVLKDDVEWPLNRGSRTPVIPVQSTI